MSGRTFTLPSTKEMLRRLEAANGSQAHAVEYLHPLIVRTLKGEGRHLFAVGILHGINIAIAEYLAPFPALPQRIYYEWLRRYIVGLVTDKRVREEALELLQGITRR